MRDPNTMRPVEFRRMSRAEGLKGARRVLVGNGQDYRVGDQAMPMNDPHVKAIHCYIKHDNSVDYSDVEPLVHDDALLRIWAEKRNVVLEPKCHYATAEEARRAAEGLVRRWEFEAALRAQSDAFRLVYERVEIVDHNPPLSPPGTVNARAVHWKFTTSKPQVTLTKKQATYPAPPSGSALDPDDPDAKSMLSRLDLYRLGREPLASMVNFCLTVVKSSGGNYQISKKVLREVGRLTAKKGGNEARKVDGLDEPFTSEEITFLETAVTAFIRRAAEKAAVPNRDLPCVTMADLPKLPNQAGLTTRQP